MKLRKNTIHSSLPATLRDAGFCSDLQKTKLADRELIKQCVKR